MHLAKEQFRTCVETAAKKRFLSGFVAGFPSSAHSGTSLASPPVPVSGVSGSIRHPIAGPRFQVVKFLVVDPVRLGWGHFGEHAGGGFFIQQEAEQGGLHLPGERSAELPAGGISGMQRLLRQFMNPSVHAATGASLALTPWIGDITLLFRSGDCASSALLVPRLSAAG